jgi:hypothetical protein
MLDAGAGECFDVLAMQGYGLNSGPTDRRMRPLTITYARPLYIRDLLVNNGYADRAIWISEAAWNPVPSPEQNPDVADRYNFGQVSEEQAARYMVGAYERQAREWGFVGVNFYWFFNRRDESEISQSFYYFRMVEPDLSPQPVYTAMSDYINNLTPTLYRGVHQADHWAVSLPDAAETVESESAQFGEATEMSAVSFIAHGTDLALRWSGGELIAIYEGDTLVETLLSDDETTYTEDGWHEARLRLSWIAQPHDIRVEAQTDDWLLDSVTVYDNTTGDVLVLGVVTFVVLAFLVGGVYLYPRRQQIFSQEPSE